MTTQPYRDAIAALEARLLAADSEWTESFAKQVAKDFIAELTEMGWVPFVTPPEPKQHAGRADPEKVHDIVSKFKAEQAAKEQGDD